MHYISADALYRFLDTTKPTGVLDQTTNAALFMLQLVWLEEVKNYLHMGQMLGILTNI
jgi:hypothetical protein